MSSAGQQLVAGRIPGERIATAIEITDSATFTDTDTEVMTVTAPLVVGRTYEVWAVARFGSDTADDRIAVRLREDNVVGTLMQQGQIESPFNSSLGFGPVVLYAEHTAAATGNKTFNLSADRNSGSGNCRMDASIAAAYMFVNYVSG